MEIAHSKRMLPSIFSKILKIDKIEDYDNKSSKICFINSQLPGKRGTGQSGWAIQSKLQMYIWLGVNKHKKEVLKGLPSGYEDSPTLRRTCRIVGTPPPVLKYNGKYYSIRSFYLIFYTYLDLS